MRAFVPASFDPPVGLDHVAFRLRPLGPEHNLSDYAAWSSSIDHIRSTPGFAGQGWPHPMTLEENLDDLVRHAGDFAARTGFTYTVLAPDEEHATVIGCVYISRASGPATTRASGPGSARRTRISTRTSTGPWPTGSKRPGRSNAWTTPSDPT